MMTSSSDSDLLIGLEKYALTKKMTNEMYVIAPVFLPYTPTDPSKRLIPENINESKTENTIKKETINTTLLFSSTPELAPSNKIERQIVPKNSKLTSRVVLKISYPIKFINKHETEIDVNRILSSSFKINPFYFYVNKRK